MLDGQHQAWAGNAGWLNARGDVTSGAVIGEYVLSGYLYSANLGWIHLGDGSPDDGIRYSNTSATDYGVNRLADGKLRGYAYSANVGWINFEAQGDANVDLLTRQFSGYAYSANVGWINLGDATYFLQAENIQPGVDTDSDGIADAWELEHTGSLVTLSATGNADSDIALDVEEYAADTDPLVSASAFRITQNDFSIGSFFIEWTTQNTRLYEVEGSTDLQNWQSVSSIRVGNVAGQDNHTVTDYPAEPKVFLRVKATVPR